MNAELLDAAIVEQILNALPKLHLGVIGDLFLDRYFDLDASLTEPSLETGLDAYQVVQVRSYPGAAGTVVNNLVALGVGRVSVLSVVGEDGEGYELRRELERQGVDLSRVIVASDRRTPTYMKPMLFDPAYAMSGPPCARELNRLDIKNRTPLPDRLQRQVLESLAGLLAEVDGLAVLDQVSEAECGIVTTAVRERLADLARMRPEKPILADSRERIGLFRHVALKPNREECRRAAGIEDLALAVQKLAKSASKPVYCTCGPDGILLAEPGPVQEPRRIPGYPVTGPVDPVGAGDSTSAGILCALALGFPSPVAAAFGNLIASITVQQIGVTGIATPEMVRRRWQEVAAG